MKELYIVRHGKSSWDNDFISDIDRPLKERGINDGYKMAERLFNENIVPDQIISSSATRAIHSALIFARSFNIPASDIKIREEIYHSNASNMIRLIKELEAEINSCMIFGHNPTFTDLANLFINNKIDNIPTTGIVGLKFEIENWDEIEDANPEDWFFDYPKKQ